MCKINININSVLSLWVVLFSAINCAATELVKPESVGFASDRLARIQPAMQAYVDD